MKRRALLIGNSNGLAGVKLDIANYAKFLSSDHGGQWFESEIIIRMNPSKKFLQETIQSIKNESPDFAFVVFSGHGAYEKSTILEINKDEEFINEMDLIGIAKRQILIFDCCRNVIIKESVELRKAGGTLSLYGSTTNTRLLYETRIMQAIEQQNRLYACSIGESSLDTEKGGLYTQNLIGSAKPQSISLYKLVGDAQDEASTKTTNMAWVNHLHRQHPTATLTKCLSSQQLIFSINPNYNILQNIR